MLKKILKILLIISFPVNTLFAADIPIIVIAPSKKAQSKSVVGTNVTVFTNSEIEKSVMENKIVDKWVEGKTIKKIIIVPKKIINIVSQ